MPGITEPHMSRSHSSIVDQDESAKSILQRQLNGLPTRSTKDSTVLAYAQPLDIALIALSTLSAIIAGALNPLLTVIYGLLVGSFQRHAYEMEDSSRLSSSVSKFTLYYVYLGIAEFILIYIATVGFYYSGERITRNLRQAYLKAIIRQNIGFFDTLGPGEVTTRICGDMNVVQEGISSRISIFLTAIATFLSAIIISFLKNWKLALILLSTSILLGGAEFVGAAFALKYSRENSASLAKGASAAEETFSSIQHVSAFGIQAAMARRYQVYLNTAEKWGLKMRLSVSVMIGAVNALPYLTYALAFWQGSRYIVSGESTASAVVTIVLATIIGAFAVGRVAPSGEAFISSISHAGTILKAITRKSPLDPFSTEGHQLPKVQGNIELHNINLTYPSRQHVQVLNTVSMKFPANKTTALVGASGCGKSSIIGLIERFYEPTGGYISKTVLKQQISYVVQEPVLFNRSIFENILLGFPDPGLSRPDHETQELVYSAARMANAHDFIMALPQGYQTEVGTKGLQLSGGQRQRICIARAIITNPKILLLDEATSALDVKSERAVQQALESAAQNRTTIVVAHRLSTIRNADNIIVMSNGSVVEQGRHDELMRKSGMYSALVEAQQMDIPAQHPVEEVEEKHVLEKERTREVVTTASIEVNPCPDGSLHDRHQQDTQEGRRPTFKTYFQTVAQLNREEAHVIFTGVFLCFIAGCVIPVQSVFFAKSINVVSLPPSQYAQLRNEINFWCLMFLMIAIVNCIAWVGQGTCFSYSTERLSHKGRYQMFRSILRQDQEFFDQKEHSPGGLSSFLSTAPTELAGLSGAVIGACLTFIATIAGGVILSLAVGWKLALVCAATIPIMTGSGYIRLRVLSLFDGQMRATHQEGAMYASEIITVIRSVASLTLESHVLDEYSRILAQRAAKTMRFILITSTLYAASQSFTFFCMALAFWYGGTLLADYEYSMLQFFTCFVALISGAQIAGAIFNFAPDMSKALHAGQRVKELFELKPRIDTWDNSGQRITGSTGQIDIVDVTFRYPNRPERLVLDRLNLSIGRGQYVALVGPSGSGKSTVIRLLERFFEPTEGKILVDGKDISQLNINDYRSLMSLVGQEPTLYEGSIRDNILLGTEREVREDELVQVCKKANIYAFISSLPDGFATLVGTGGTMLSGGQRQRLSIARALLRDARILLLDEATSALDSESEKAVQDALDNASRERTTIAIAHRLSTIQNADFICVLDHGRVVEKGTYAQLLAKKGLFHNLVQMQSLGAVGPVN
ncbi:ABC multidrug transporter, putative [Trichophyton benhamiae CBS 112371]|uniref:ABC multidrug transporter, putative n=1 Tax=Arthroderma benhamiae (strain ATCC MYA-4681 / CBS 112371) TaxID=663331 RepID=D4AMX7_ARTBC|nr:ABC multidrug transporter, putative [Trichophyton benhamiae CBS 112371]EFE35538.1 ABC multidrug transporter, putative [Trichophyton benhamiae CBS 112371]